MTPLIAVVVDGAVHLCTGLREQKARNPRAPTRRRGHHGDDHVGGGARLWSSRGTARRVADRDGLQRVAGAYLAKYGEAWRFAVGDGVYGAGEDAAAVFRVEAAEVLAFAKAPHAQTTFRPA